jgi:hypothetical protein
LRASRHLSIRLGGAALLATVLASVAAPAALAVAPVGERNELVARDIPGFIDCGTVALDYHVDVRRTISEYFDNDGNLVRWVANVHYFGTVTNPETGLVATDNGARMIVDDFRTQQSTITGGAHHVTWPGGGLIFGELGRLVFDWNGTPENFDDDVLRYARGIHTEAQLVEDICAVLG